MPNREKYREILKVKVGKHTVSFNDWSTLSKSQKRTEPCVRKGSRSLLACHTRCKRSMGKKSPFCKGRAWYQFHKTGKKIALEVTVTGQVSEYY